jgi:hypothetical protein
MRWRSCAKDHELTGKVLCRTSAASTTVCLLSKSSTTQITRCCTRFECSVLQQEGKQRALLQYSPLLSLHLTGSIGLAGKRRKSHPVVADRASRALPRFFQLQGGGVRVSFLAPHPGRRNLVYTGHRVNPNIPQDPKRSTSIFWLRSSCGLQ